MMITTQETQRRSDTRRPMRRASRGLAGLVSVLVIVGTCLLPILGTADAGEDEDRSHGGRFCSATANILFRACGFEVLDDYWVAVAKCLNVSNDAPRAQCLDDAKDGRREGNQLCSEQRESRRDSCVVLGEGRYDPDFDPALFDKDFANLTTLNRYFPLLVGNRWEYRGGTETVTVEVLNETKLIAGVRCIVVRDVVRDNGRLMEDTDDWFAQAKDGNVWYCGEEVKDYETFRGDRPQKPELVDIAGSFKAGRNGDKPGIVFSASPIPGEVYRQEFSLGNAEDVAEVLSTTYGFGTDLELDRFVPQLLATLLCAADCVVTREFSLLEPGISARKYYAPGIGLFLEVKPDDGEIVQLVSCNVNQRCQQLPNSQPNEQVTAP